MDKFLFSENILMEVEKIFSWVEVGGGLDHLRKLLQIDKKDQTQTTHFKFNIEWEKDEECIQIVKEEWVNFNSSSMDAANFQFVEALKNVRKVVAAWVAQKHKDVDKELKEVECSFLSLYENNSTMMF